MITMVNRPLRFPPNQNQRGKALLGYLVLLFSLRFPINTSELVNLWGLTHLKTPL